jgi:hypothetical protein
MERESRGCARLEKSGADRRHSSSPGRRAVANVGQTATAAIATGQPAPAQGAGAVLRRVRIAGRSSLVLLPNADPYYKYFGPHFVDAFDARDLQL